MDSENANSYESILVNATPATLIIKDSTVSVTWIANGCLLALQTEVSVEETIKIAESVRFKK